MLYPVYRFIYNIYFHPLSKFPGPRFAAATKIPIAWVSWNGRLSQWVNGLHTDYDSEVVRISPDELDFIQPAAWKDIHMPAQGRPFGKDLLVFAGVQNIVTAPDPDHRRLRRLVNHAFSDKALREQEPLIAGHVRKLTCNLSSLASHEGKANLTESFMYVVFDIISDLSFGKSFNCQESSTHHVWVSQVIDSITIVVLDSVAKRFPGLEYIIKFAVPTNIAQSRDNHFAWSAEQVQRRLNSEVERPDLLAYITKKDQDPEKGGMSPEEVYQTAAAFLAAGAETTAAHSTATIFFLLKHPAYHKQLVDEIRTEFASAEDICLQRIIEKLPFLQAIIDEVFRMYPPAIAGQPRVSPPGGGYVAGHFVAEGTGVQMNQYAANHSKFNFEDPEVFEPKRWLDEGKGIRGVNRREAMQPFGMGARNCVGKK